MKYWFGYLTAAILGLITWALVKLAEKYTTLVDLVYPYVTRTVQGFLSAWTGGADHLVWQVAVVLLVVAVLATLVLVIVLRKSVIGWFGWVLTGAALLLFLHTGIYGLNYHAGPLADDMRLPVTEYTMEELEEATVWYRDLANELAPQMSRDAQGNVLFGSFAELSEQAGEGFKVLTYERSISVFAGDTTSVKELGWADMYTSMGIMGITMPLTGEVAVNPQIPAIALPYTMCHELAHRMCIAKEQDANFSAFLACQMNSSKEFRYSAYFSAYRYCYDVLASMDQPEAAVAAARIAAGVGPELRQDLLNYEAFFSDRMDDGMARFATKANDFYLKVSGDEHGVDSYGSVVDLLVAWHIQEIVLPAQKEEAEILFDPYDEEQVDLSGIVGAMGD